MEPRKRRTFIHKGKVRHRRKLPRKVKKNEKKEMVKFLIRFRKYLDNLIKKYPDNWGEHIIFGG